MTLLVLFLAALWAGVQNALAGGGSFVTLPALMFTGMDARAANITSTVALFPAQIATALTGRRLVTGAAGVSFRALVTISLLGGAIGAVLLLVTPSTFFAHLVPWLVLFATLIFAWGSFAPKRASHRHLSRRGAMAAQFGIAIYGGYFGGGIGFLMLAVLTAAGLVMRNAGATKNALAGVMNASAMLIFVFSPQVRWLQAGIASAGAITGGILGGLLLHRLNERLLRVVIVLIGLALTLGLFIR
ncbi:MAG TPA: sulfite exporter TauE/SafE family protein [Steroidobacteraceae bacterium]|nr:sulfite exporter TauE/SafE family protein [Steroidobacteraceae bacterium]